MALVFLNNNSDEKGKTTGFNFQVHLYPRKWAVDLMYVAPKGYHLNQKDWQVHPQTSITIVKM
jgi:hypothetical protein